MFDVRKSSSCLGKITVKLPEQRENSVKWLLVHGEISEKFDATGPRL